ncbi:MAG: hypothetical protein WDN50_10105 [Bradyrhizobium sp.]
MTRAHGDATGAPYYFVRITFNEVNPVTITLAGRYSIPTRYSCTARSAKVGPTEMKDTLMACLATDVAIASLMQPNCVWVYLSEIPPNQMIEFGRVLPLHGKEAEWSAALPQAEKVRLDKIGIRKEVAA